jgi:excisionase family DNA binding protein
MTVKEVAAALRVCTATVYSMIERGELEHTQVSKRPDGGEYRRHGELEHAQVSNAIRVVVRECQA